MSKRRRGHKQRQTKGWKKLRVLVLDRDGHKCRYCGRNSKDVVLHVDHIIPVAEGGTNDLDNLQTLCADCNLGKSDALLNEAREKKRDRIATQEARRKEAERERLALAEATQKAAEWRRKDEERRRLDALRALAELERQRLDALRALAELERQLQENERRQEEEAERRRQQEEYRKWAEEQRRQAEQKQREERWQARKEWIRTHENLIAIAATGVFALLLVLGFVWMHAHGVKVQKTRKAEQERVVAEELWRQEQERLAAEEREREEQRQREEEEKQRFLAEQRQREEEEEQERQRIAEQIRQEREAAGCGCCSGGAVAMAAIMAYPIYTSACWITAVFFG